MTDSPSDKLTEDSQPAISATREVISRTEVVQDDLAGKRFDQIAALLFPEFSRGRLQQWIESGSLTADNKIVKSKQKLQAGCTLNLNAEFEKTVEWKAEPLPLNIIFEDENLLVVNKPRHCVVHPAPGLSSGTLANAVLSHCPGNAELPRCGIIHRLDKDTTGLLVIAKSLSAHASLVEQLQERSVKRLYRAIVCGTFISGGTIDVPIGRHNTQRTKMAVYNREPISQNAKVAITHYRILKRFSQHTELAVQLETGRTHQIRVHMAHIRHPLVGDATYNPRYKRPAEISDALNEQLKRFSRQALHATELSFVHPTSHETCTFNAEPPEDYNTLLAALVQEDN